MRALLLAALLAAAGLAAADHEAGHQDPIVPSGDNPPASPEQSQRSDQFGGGALALWFVFGMVLFALVVAGAWATGRRASRAGGRKP